MIVAVLAGNFLLLSAYLEEVFEAVWIVEEVIPNAGNACTRMSLGQRNLHDSVSSGFPIFSRWRGHRLWLGGRQTRKLE